MNSLGMWAKFTIPVIASILILGVIGLSEDAYAIGGTISDQASCEAIGGSFSEHPIWSGTTKRCYLSNEWLTIRTYFGEGETLTISNGVYFLYDNSADSNAAFTIDSGAKLINHGLIEISESRVYNRGTIINELDGTIIYNGYAPEGKKFINSGSITNRGIITNEFSASTLENDSTGTIINHGGTINNINGATLVNSGAININPDGKITNSGTIDNNGGTITSAGTINNSGNIKYGDIINNGGATINNNAGGTFGAYPLTNLGTFNNNADASLSGIFSNNVGGLLTNDGIAGGIKHSFGSTYSGSGTTSGEISLKGNIGNDVDLSLLGYPGTTTKFVIGSITARDQLVLNPTLSFTIPSGYSLINHGEILIQHDASMTNSGTIVNERGSTLINKLGTLTNFGTIINEGESTLIIESSTLTNFGTIINKVKSALIIESGTIINSGVIKHFFLYGYPTSTITSSGSATFTNTGSGQVALTGTTPYNIDLSLYGYPATLTTFNILSGDKLSISELTIPTGYTLNLSGTLVVETLTNSGLILNSGILIHHLTGPYSGSGTFTNTDIGRVGITGDISSDVDLGSLGYPATITTFESGVPISSDVGITYVSGATISSGGSLTIPSGYTLNNAVIINSGGTLTNSGTLNIKRAGGLINEGTLENQPTAIINNFWKLNNLGILNNLGTINNSVDLSFVNLIPGTIDNSGTINNHQGTINNDCNGTITGPILGNAIVDVCNTVPPVITVPADITAPVTSSSGETVSYSVSATDNVGGTLTPTCSPASGSTFLVGTTTVTCTAIDHSGKSAVASFTVTLIDSIPPVITVPADMTVEATAQFTPTSYYVSATDDVDPNPTLTCTPSKGLFGDTFRGSYPVGTTTVTCTATDASGNSATASFTVTVNTQDTIPPVITVPADMTTKATSSSGATVSYSVSVTDDVDPNPTLTCTPASGSTFPLGTTTVTCTATDGTNSATASFTVTVQDTIPPVITVPADMTSQATSSSGTTVKYSVSVTDNIDPNPSLTCKPASGSTFPVGTTTVACKATDASTNSATASFTVTVSPSEPASYVKYAYTKVSSGTYRYAAVYCNSGDVAIGGGAYFHPYYGYVSGDWPFYSYVSGKGYQAYAWAGYFKNISPYSTYGYVYAICRDLTP